MKRGGDLPVEVTSTSCSTHPQKKDPKEFTIKAEKTSTHPLIKLPLEEAGGDAADSVAVAGDLRPADGQSGGFGRQSGLQVEVDGPLEVSLALLHLAGLLILTRLH